MSLPVTTPRQPATELSTPLIAVVRGWLGVTIPITSLALFFDGMAIMLHAGRSVADVLRNEGSCGCDPELQHISGVIAPRVRNGAALSACLRPYKSRFPEIVLCLLEVGEASGTMEGCAKRLADTFNQTTKTARRFKFGTYDPGLLLAAIAGIQLVHLIIGAEASSAQNRSMVQVGLSIVLQEAVTIGEMVATFLFGRAVLKRAYLWLPLRLGVDTIKLAIPRIGLVFRNLSAARWARSFATLWGAGVNISSALEVSSSSTLNAYYERALRSAAVQTRMGRSLSDCIVGIDLLPAHLLSIIATCEIAGRMDEALPRLAADMETEALDRAIVTMNQIVVGTAFVLMVAAFAM